MEEFFYQGKKYLIKDTAYTGTIGDFDERNSLVLVDKEMPKRFLKGIAVHEIEERKFIRLGYSYGAAHLEAQKKELEFYAELLGSPEKALAMLKDEERIVLRLFLKGTKKELINLEKKFAWLFVSPAVPSASSPFPAKPFPKKRTLAPRPVSLSPKIPLAPKLFLKA